MALKLDEENYYSSKADVDYMSYSQFKMFKECEAKALATIKGEYKRKSTRSMLVGSYVDAWLGGEQEFNRFIEKNYDSLYTKKGGLYADLQQAQNIIDFIKNDEYFMKLLKGNRQVILTGVIAGVPFKAKLDSLLKDCIVDGKVMKDCEPVYKNGEYQPFWKAYGYNYQAAIYRTLVAQNFGELFPFKLAVVTKEDVPDKRIFNFTENTIKEAYDEICALAPRYQKIKQGLEEPIECGECDYCRSKKILTKEMEEDV